LAAVACCQSFAIAAAFADASRYLRRLRRRRFLFTLFRHARRQLIAFRHRPIRLLLPLFSLILMPCHDGFARRFFELPRSAAMPPLLMTPLPAEFRRY
jgi:hypothetical protein